MLFESKFASEHVWNKTLDKTGILRATGDSVKKASDSSRLPLRTNYVTAGILSLDHFSPTTVSPCSVVYIIKDIIPRFMADFVYCGRCNMDVKVTEVKHRGVMKKKS